MENARLRLEITARKAREEELLRQIASNQERNEILAVQHSLEIQRHLSEAQHLREIIDEARKEMREMRRELREQEILRQERDKAIEQRDNSRRKAAKLAAQQSHSQTAVQEFSRRTKGNAWGTHRVSIRNCSPLAATDPKKEVMAILARLQIKTNADDVIVMKCSEMLPSQDRYQILVEFRQVSEKLEFISKFSQLSDHELAGVRALSLRDSLVTAELHKRANSILHGKKGLSYTKIVNDQVIVKIASEEHPREVSTEVDIEAIVELLDDGTPSTSVQNRRQRRARNRREH